MDSDGRTALPDDLRTEATRVLNKVGAYLGSRGDPEVMESFKEPPSYVALLGLSFVLAAIVFILSELANYYEIQRNWSHYRCLPSVAPFAKFYGYDLAENLSFCTAQAVKEHAGGVINPIYSGIAEVSTVIDKVYGKVESVESGIMGLIAGFQRFVTEFINSFRLLGTRIQMGIIRLRDIFGRIHGIFIAFAYAAISAITFGQNLICNPLIVFIGGLAGADLCCFAPWTLLQREDGQFQRICDTQIGDCLAGGARVSSVFEFAGSATPMVQIRGVIVSGNHYVRHTGRWIPADQHPEAVGHPSLERIWCLGTTTNEIPVGDLVFTDFEESSEPAVVAAAQRMTEAALNPGDTPGPTVPDYSLGLDPGFRVLLANGSWKRMEELSLGDRLASGASVAGRVRESCADVCLTPAGHLVSAAQLVFHEGRWLRAGHLWKRVPASQPMTLYQITLTHNVPFAVAADGETWMVRDYFEWNTAEAEEPYRVALSQS